MKTTLIVFFIFSLCLRISLSGNAANCHASAVAPLPENVTDSFKNVIDSSSDDTTKMAGLLKLGEQIYMQQPDSAIALWELSESIARAMLDSLNTREGKNQAFIRRIQLHLSAILNDIGFVCDNMGRIPEALEYYNKSMDIDRRLDDRKGMSTSLNNIGYIYYNQGDILKALEYFHRSLHIREDIDDKEGMADCLNNIGYIYKEQEDITNALKYYYRSLEMFQQINNEQGIAYIYHNIGGVYLARGDSALNSGNRERANDMFDTSLVFFQKSIDINESLGNKKWLAGTYNNMGLVYKYKKDLNKAMEYYNKDLKISTEIGDKEGMANSLYNLGKVALKRNDRELLKKYAVQSYTISNELGYPDDIECSASLMKDLAVLQGNYKKAFEYYQEEMAMRDSVRNEDNFKQTQKRQARYEYQKQKAVDSVAHAKAIQIKNLELAKANEEKAKQKVIIYSFICGFAVIMVFSAIIFNLFLQKKKANRIISDKNTALQQANEEITAQKEEIEAQRDEITAQRDEIALHRDVILQQKEEIEDSIRYAKRIQTAVLPADKYAGEILGDHFIIFRPKDVVSGDFYWATTVTTTNSRYAQPCVSTILVVAVADCTGHGVPGAFMSMLGISFLNEIVRKKENTIAAQILDMLRDSVIDALKQTGASTDSATGSIKDGMDITLAVIETDTLHCRWAGANNPLWIINTHGHACLQTPQPGSPPIVTEIKPDKMPVAIHPKMEPFTNHEMQLHTGDRLYMFTDGFPDQFGGPKGKKFKYRAFKQLIADTCMIDIKEQGRQMEKTLLAWIHPGHGTRYDQVDDITVLGIKL
ncbi:MAG: tetratricopeptide repeat protein [Bacteroidetes bacterium]|nr:tetratricopeptide repeat protein [Bacteroidota bacterium]